MKKETNYDIISSFSNYDILEDMYQAQELATKDLEYIYHLWVGAKENEKQKERNKEEEEEEDSGGKYGDNNYGSREIWFNLPLDCNNVILPQVGIHGVFRHLIFRYCVVEKYKQTINDFS